LVTNLALCLAGEAGRLTLAADMVLPDGQVASRLGLLPAQSWLESPAANFDRLAPCLVHHSRGLFALPAPAALPQEGLPGPQVVAQQLQTFREWLDYVVLDTPLNLGPWAPALIGSSPLILLLLRTDEASLQKAQASLAAIKRLGSQAMQIWPVLNMVQPDQEAFRQQAEEILSLPVMAMLPWSPEERETGPANHKPLLLRHPKSPLAAAIRDLARQIVHVADIEVGAEGKQG
jgi:Flp pilus assembly CpaE family ATPase